MMRNDKATILIKVPITPKDNMNHIFYKKFLLLSVNPAANIIGGRIKLKNGSSANPIIDSPNYIKKLF